MEEKIAMKKNQGSHPKLVTRCYLPSMENKPTVLSGLLIRLPTALRVSRICPTPLCFCHVDLVLVLKFAHLFLLETFAFAAPIAWLAVSLALGIFKSSRI